MLLKKNKYYVIKKQLGNHIPSSAVCVGVVKRNSESDDSDISKGSMTELKKII